MAKTVDDLIGDLDEGEEDFTSKQTDAQKKAEADQKAKDEAEAKERERKAEEDQKAADAEKAKQQKAADDAAAAAEAASKDEQAKANKNDEGKKPARRASPRQNPPEDDKYAERNALAAEIDEATLSPQTRAEMALGRKVVGNRSR